MIRAACVLWLAWFEMAHGQSLPDLADGLVADPHIPGATVGVVSAEALDWAVAGERTEGSGDAVGREDLWHIGSLTKSMTATLAARLVARGAMVWERPVADGGPNLQQLLSHRAGLLANPSMIWLIRLPGDPAEAQGPWRARLTAWALDRRGADGAEVYSNLGYIVAGQMLAEAAGQEWEAALQAEVFAPLGIDSAGFGAPVGAQPVGHRAGPRPVPPGPRADNPPAFGPAGTVHLSTEDMLRYLRAHLLADGEFLPEALWDHLHGRGGGDALGWVAGETGMLWHNGSNTFWYAEAVVDRAGGRAAFVAVNSGDLAHVQAPVGAALRAALALD